MSHKNKLWEEYMRYLYQALALCVSSNIMFLPVTVEARGFPSVLSSTARKVHESREDRETYTPPLPPGGRGAVIGLGQFYGQEVLPALNRGGVKELLNELDKNYHQPAEGEKEGNVGSFVMFSTTLALSMPLIIVGTFSDIAYDIKHKVPFKWILPWQPEGSYVEK